jgi:hypothetical protein
MSNGPTPSSSRPGRPRLFAWPCPYDACWMSANWSILCVAPRSTITHIAIGGAGTLLSMLLPRFSAYQQTGQEQSSGPTKRVAYDSAAWTESGTLNLHLPACRAEVADPLLQTQTAIWRVCWQICFRLKPKFLLPKG